MTPSTPRRETTDGRLEASSPERTRMSSDPRDSKYRLVCRRGGPWEIGQEELTSASPSAQVTEKRCFVLTTEEAIWLHGAMGELLAEMYGETWEQLHRAQMRVIELESEKKTDLVDRRGRALGVGR